MSHTIAEIRNRVETVRLGFWVYLLTDAVLFSTLFATYLVLKPNINGGPAAGDLYDLTFVLIETFILLTSSYTVGLAALALRAGKIREFIGFVATTIALGIGFLVMELSEFGSLIAEGHTWQSSAFLSAFFTLVGTHGFHILIGLVWGATLLWALYRQGARDDLVRKFGLFSLFWHFLDVVWIFIFTIVYVLGVI